MNKQEMIQAITKYVPDTLEGSRENDECAYQCEDGSRCAVGAIADDKTIEKLHKDMEGTGANTFSVSLIDRLPLSRTKLIELQMAHDQQIEGTTARQRCIDWIEENVHDKN